MNELLNNLRKQSNKSYVNVTLVSVMTFLSLLGLVSLVSDTGYSNEITSYRLEIWIGLIITTIIGCFCYYLFWFDHMRWTTYYKAIVKLQDKIYLRPELGGIRPNFVIGVNQGGALIGGFLYYNLRFFFTIVWPDQEWSLKRNYNEQRNELYENMQRVLNSQGNQNDSAELRILIVDDSFKSGTSMGKALKMVKDAVKMLDIKNVIIKTAVIVYRPDLRIEEKSPPPDFYVFNHFTHFPYSKI